MRLAGIALGIVLFTAPAAAQFIDRDAVFARAREIATEALPGVESSDLMPFHIGYDLSLLETGNPCGGFDVVLLLRSSREALAAGDVIAAAPDAEVAARLGKLLAGAEFAYHYRTINVHFPERGGEPVAAGYSTLLLNRDPDAEPPVVSSPLTIEPRQTRRNMP